MNSGVYLIKNTVSGSEYVGSAVNLRHRWVAHRCALRNHGKAPPKLQRAWDKYGADAFEFFILECCPREELLLREQFHIDLRKPKYNTRAQAHSNIGVKWSAETNRRKGRPQKVYTVRGITGSLKFLCKTFGVVTPQGAKSRLAKGMSIEDAVTTPGMHPRERGKLSASTRSPGSHRGADLEFRGVRGSLQSLVDRFGVVDYYAARARRQRGWPLDRVLLEPPVPAQARSRRACAARWGAA